MLKNKNPKILISPLDWGLGHATRCIPIIKLLLQNNFRVAVASCGSPLKVIQTEFPNIEYIHFPSVTINYSGKIPAFLHITFQIPKILFGICREKFLIRKIIKKHDIDLIISDNRYGVFSKKIPSIFITHQIAIKLPKSLIFFEPVLYKIHKKIISKFDKVFIPDIEGKDNISGDLSHRFPKPKNAIFIGILSRFEYKPENEIKYDLLVIISGPEPDRTYFYMNMLYAILVSGLKTLILTGLPQENYRYKSNNITTVSHLKTAEMQEVINSSETIICRSGYSSIMDLLTLNKKAILIPSKGQTEQEYLAEFHHKKNSFIKQDIENIDIKKGIEELEVLKPAQNNYFLNKNIILKTINDLLFKNEKKL